MKIDILQAPEVDIMRDHKKYAVFFCFFLALAGLGVAIGVYAIYFNTRQYEKLDTAALVFFVGASFFISYFGQKLQAYKRLYPPQKKKLAELRGENPVVDNYCKQVEALGRRMIKAEFDECENYAERHPGIPFV